MGLPGKPKGIDGGEVERYFHEGKIKEIADYCESDVINTYRVWLRYELFRGTRADGYRATEVNCKFLEGSFDRKGNYLAKFWCRIEEDALIRDYRMSKVGPHLFMSIIDREPVE